VAVLDTDIERAHVDGSQIGVARGGRCAPIGKVLSDDSGGSSDSLFRAMKGRLERAGVNTLSAREGGGL